MTISQIHDSNVDYEVAYQSAPGRPESSTNQKHELQGSYRDDFDDIYTPI